MKKKIALVIIILILIMVILKPIGTISYYFNFDKDDPIHINEIIDGKSGKVIFLDESEMDRIYNEFINIRYIFRIHRTLSYTGNLGGGLDYSFKLNLNDINYYVNLNEKEVIMTREKNMTFEDTDFYSFRITNNEKIYILFEELFK